MEITIKATPKEIADLVLAVQDRQIPANKISINGKEIAEKIRSAKL